MLYGICDAFIASYLKIFTYFLYHQVGAHDTNVSGTRQLDDKDKICMVVATIFFKDFFFSHHFAGAHWKIFGVRQGTYRKIG